MGYHSKALLYMEGAKGDVSEMVEYLNSRSNRGSTIRLVGTELKDYNSYDLITDRMIHEDPLFEGFSTIVFSMGWFKAYGEWESAVADIKSKSESLRIAFHYCRIGENLDDIEIDNPDDSPEIGVERRFVIPREFYEAFEDVEVL